MAPANCKHSMAQYCVSTARPPEQCYAQSEEGRIQYTRVVSVPRRPSLAVWAYIAKTAIWYSVKDIKFLSTVEDTRPSTTTCLKNSSRNEKMEFLTCKLKVKKQNTKEKLCDTELSMTSWIWHQNTDNKSKNKMDYIKMKKFCVSKDKIKSKKGKLWNGRKYLQII